MTLTNQILDLLRVAEGPVRITRVLEVLGVDRQRALQALLELLQQGHIIEARLPGDRITYRLNTADNGVPTGVVPGPNDQAPKRRPPSAKKAGTVGARDILTHLAGVETATCLNIAHAYQGNTTRISAALAKLMGQARVAAVPNTRPRQYRITQMGRDSLAKPTERRWGETRPKPVPPPAPKAPEPAITDLPDKLHVLTVMANAHNPRIAKVLRAVRDDLQSLSGAST